MLHWKEATGADEAFEKIVRYLARPVGVCTPALHTLHRTDPRGQATNEVWNISIPYNFAEYSPFCRRFAEPNVKRYFAHELRWYFSGSPWLRHIVEGSSFHKKATNDGVTLNSAYGARLTGKHPHRPVYDAYTGDGHPEQWGTIEFDQLKYCVDLLTRDRNSRRAIAVILERADLLEDMRMEGQSKDIPCTVSIQWYIRNGNELNQIVTMRSNDVMRGFVYDVPCFAFYHAWMLDKLNNHPDNSQQLFLGTYWHNVHSMHLYDKWYDRAYKLVDGQYWLQEMDNVQKIYVPFEDEGFASHLQDFAAGTPASEEADVFWQTLSDWFDLEKRAWT